MKNNYEIRVYDDDMVKIVDHGIDKLAGPNSALLSANDRVIAVKYMRDSGIWRIRLQGSDDDE